MEIRKLTKALLLISGLSGFSAYAADTTTTNGLYMNGQWDPACSQCWPSPRTDKNNHCKPTDCAIQGMYHCKQQNPPLEIDDDPRMIGLIKSGDCTFAPRVSLNEGESKYVESLRQCTAVLDKMAGRFTLPANPGDASKMKMDFYLTNFKAAVLGSAYDQLKLAIDYDIGMGTQQDRNRATELYNKAAVKGVLFAQYAIGARYAYGISVPKDRQKAIMWLNKALHYKPKTEADKSAQALVTPCAIKLIERLTPT